MADGVDAPGQTQEREWGALVFVIGVWAILTIGLFVVAVRTASPIPWIDDWDLVRPLTGDRPIAQWLWEPYINHSVPLPRILLLGIYTLNHGDFRAAPYVNVAVLSALALFMIFATGRIRGRVEFSDAVFPIALLNIDREILFATLGVNLIPSTVFSCLVLVLLLKADAHHSRRTLIVGGLLTLALAMCGSSGAAQVPPLALWLAYLGFRHWRSAEPEGRTSAFLAWGIAIAVLVYLAASFPKLEDRDPGLKAALRTSLECLSTAFGPAAMTLNNSLFGPRPWLGLIVVVLGMATAILLVVVFLRFPHGRSCALGLIMLLAGMYVFALGVGWGRADKEPGAGYATRYTVYTAPLLFTIYHAWLRYGGAILSRLLPFGMFAVLCGLLGPNMGQSYDYVKGHVQTAHSVERDLLAGVPPSLLAERYATFLLTGDGFRDHLAKCMRLLHQSGMGIFRSLKDPDVVAVRIPIKPERVKQVIWYDGLAQCTGDDPVILFSLEAPTFVYAIRVRGRYENAGDDVQFQIYWKDDRQEFSDTERNLFTILTDLSKEQNVPKEQSVLAVVNTRIQDFRIDPAHKPCNFRIDSIEVIVPEGEASTLHRE